MGPEDRLTIDVAKYIRDTYPDILFCHIPNGGRRRVFEAVKLKRMGVRAGMPDIMIFQPKYNNGLMSTCGLYIELKIGKNRPSVAQKESMNLLSGKGGWMGAVCYDYESVKKLIDNYLNG